MAAAAELDELRRVAVGGRALIFCGIDPGLDGAVAFYFEATGTEADGILVFDTPTVEVKKPKGGRRREYDVPAMRNLLNPAVPGLRYAVLEQGSPRPGEGVVSAYRIGLGIGLWRGLLTALGVAFQTEHPATWKARGGFRGLDKAAMRLRAQERFPMAPLARVKDHNRAEALFLAEYARRLYRERRGEG